MTISMNWLAGDEAAGDEAAGDEAAAKSVAAKNAAVVSSAATACDALEFTHCGRSNELSGGR